MSRITTNDTVGRTFFCVVQQKSLETLRIEQQWDNITDFEKTLIIAFSDVLGHNNFYGTICISAEGLKHIHLVVTFDKPKRFSTVAKLLGNAHIEQQRGTKEQAINYIEKKGKFEEKGEKILGYFGDKNAIQDNHGQRTDLDLEKAIKDGVLNASTLNQYILENAKTETQAKRITSVYTRQMQEIYNKNNARNKVEVIYVFGKTGSGKTQGAYEKFNDIFRTNVSEKTSFPFNGYCGQKTLLLDELRPGTFKVAELFSILDSHPINLDVKYGQFPACYNTVVITTAFPFEKWFTDETYESNDNHLQQFRRRITKLYKAENGQWIDLNYQWNNDTKKATWNDDSQWLNHDTTDSIPFLTE